MTRTFVIHTLGCKVNQYESQNMRERLLEAGLREGGKKADIVVVNSCTVTGRADRETEYTVRRCRRENSRALIIATGCMAKFDGDKLRAAGADTVVSGGSKHRIAAFISKKRPVSRAGGSYPDESISFFEGHTRAFLKIQDGCDNFCSYCKVPLVRGRPKSKPLRRVRGEAEALVRRGYREIVLTGICLGAYGKDRADGSSLVDAITVLEGIEGLRRIRLSSIELLHVTDSLREKLASSSVLCPHLHIPLQSGDDSILKAMRRPYTAAEFLAKVERVRARVRDMAITTDVMAGFPGESDRNFANTLTTLEKLKPARIHIFPFSCRPGTVAAGMSGSVCHRLVKERAQALKKLADSCREAFESRLIGTKREVLFERCHNGVWEGYTPDYMPVFLRSRKRLGGFVRQVELTGRADGGLFAILSRE